MSRGRAVLDIAQSLVVALPVVGVAAWILGRGGIPDGAWKIFAGACALSVAIAIWMRAALGRRLRTIASVLASYREGDFSIRARPARAAGDAPLDEVMGELNELGATLRQQRLGAMEAWALLRKVLSEVDVVVIAFDGEGRVRLANDAAARLLDEPATALSGKSAVDLGIAALLEGDAPRVVKDVTVLGKVPWELRRGAFRLSGEPHTLVVLSDVSAALRDVERDAWRRLIRVMGHEINNSLTPIRSMSDGLLAQLAAPPPRAATFDRDLKEALEVIARRSEALGRFMASYAMLAKLPAPRRSSVALRPLVEKVVRLEQRVSVEIDAASPALEVDADPDQLEQVLINLVKNATEAAKTTNGGARVRWTSAPPFLEIEIEDDGPGVSETKNLFVPFFTTKPEGSGIGLVLCREIVLAHKGDLSLSTREDGRGAVARVRLPLAP